MFIRPVPDTFKRYLDTDNFKIPQKKYLDIYTFNIFLGKKYLNRKYSQKMYLNTDTFLRSFLKKYLHTVSCI